MFFRPDAHPRVNRSDDPCDERPGADLLSGAAQRRLIRLADNEGQVSEIGVLATKILTRENYIVTVPNAVVVSGKC